MRGTGVKQDQSDYQEWVARFSRKQFTRTDLHDVEQPLKLVVTAVEGDEKKTKEESSLGYGSGIVEYGTELSTDGEAWGFSRTDFGTKGGGGGKPMPVEEMKRLDELLAKLPDDKSRLPPAGRRVLVQARVGERLITRVYDRAELPDAVLEVFRQGRCNVGSWVLEFKPESEIDARGFESGGFFCLTRDKRQILFGQLNGPLQRWEPTTHEFLGEVALPVDFGGGVAVSPDGSLVVTGGGQCFCLDSRTWKVIKKFEERRSEGGYFTLDFPEFTPDGHHVILQCSKPSLEIYDTRTWQRVDRLPEVPEDALQYLLSPKGNCAVVRLKSGALVLWDVRHRHQVAVLDTNAYATHVSFAPNESLVAVATAQKPAFHAYWGGPRLRLWKTDTGKPVHELKARESGIYESIEGLGWSPDSQYVLAMAVPDGFFTSRNICVFNAGSGRHRADFTGCPTTVNGMCLLPEEGQITAGCEDGRIRFWDFDSAMKKVRAFEASLAAR